MKNQRGITLIALVVTIIVLLILAGVAIAMLSGENGILKRASQSSVENALGAAEDKVALDVTTAVTDYYKVVYVDGDNTEYAVYDAANLDKYITSENTYTTKYVVDYQVTSDVKVKTTWSSATTDATLELEYTDGSTTVGTLNDGKITWSRTLATGN